MFDWIKTQLETWRVRRRLTRDLDPRQFQGMASEIRHLATLLVRTSPEQHATRKTIQDIIADMDRLDNLVNTPEFRRLPTGKRLLLKKGLEQSLQRLLQTADSHPAPTNTLQ